MTKHHDMLMVNSPLHRSVDDSPSQCRSRMTPAGRQVCGVGRGPQASPTLGRPIFQAKTGEEHHALHWVPGGASGTERRGDCQLAVWPLSP